MGGGGGVGGGGGGGEGLFFLRITCLRIDAIALYGDRGYCNPVVMRTQQCCVPTAIFFQDKQPMGDRSLCRKSRIPQPP